MQENGNLTRNERCQWIETGASSVEKLPARVEAVIAQRINRLEDPLRDMLVVASVEGEIFTTQVVARVLGMDERLVYHRLAGELDRRHRLVQEHSESLLGQQRLNRYQFGHSLFQEYLYRQLSRGERREYHGAVAAALEDVLYAGKPDTNRLSTWVYPERGDQPEQLNSELVNTLSSLPGAPFLAGAGLAQIRRLCHERRQTCHADLCNARSHRILRACSAFAGSNRGPACRVYL